MAKNVAVAIPLDNFQTGRRPQQHQLKGEGMTDSSKSSSNRSIQIAGHATGNVLQTGDRNVAAVQYQRATLPPPELVDIQAELAALRELLAQLDSPDRRKIDNALGEAEDEEAKPQPDKDEVGKALGRALDYAQKAQGFAKAIETLTPHVVNVASWLGSHWHTLLAAVGLAG
jgi:hypothetical protein